MEYWLWLTQLQGIGSTIGKRLLQKFGSPKGVFEAEETELMEVDGVGTALTDFIRKSRNLDIANRCLEDINRKGIKLLTYNDPLYPMGAKIYPRAPILLYYKGYIREDSMGVAIVGSRRCSDYGKYVAVEAAGYLARRGIPIISGLAKGIDGYAHIACIKEDGYTIAFLGNGLDFCYPKEHMELMESIIEHGAVISEYPPNTRPRQEYFPKRNALISSWSKKVLIVEAAERSGALITYQLAMSQGKEVFVVPHEIYNNSGKGTNRLISEGAKIYLEPNQLLETEKFSSTNNDESLPLINRTKIFSNKKKSRIPLCFIDSKDLTPMQRKILTSIEHCSKSIDEIGRDTKISQIDLLQNLSIMELEGMVSSLPGGRFLAVPGT